MKSPEGLRAVLRPHYERLISDLDEQVQFGSGRFYEVAFVPYVGPEYFSRGTRRVLVIGQAIHEWSVGAAGLGPVDTKYLADLPRRGQSVKATNSEHFVLRQVLPYYSGRPELAAAGFQPYGKGDFWKWICERIDSVANPGRKSPYPVPRSARAGVVRKIAWSNLFKFCTPKPNTVPTGEIRSAQLPSLSMLRTEIEYLDPDVVVCCTGKGLDPALKWGFGSWGRQVVSADIDRLAIPWCRARVYRTPHPGSWKDVNWESLIHDASAEGAS